jgi:diguanylate cyclase (GGDEF)-like protein
VAVPLLGDTAVVGVLAVYSSRARRFTPAEVGVLQSMAAIAVTVWQQIDHREQLSHRALHDPLTGLPNRVLLMDRLEHALSRRPGTRAGGSGAAVALIDLDHFKSVNDGLGHAAGDAVLREVGRRLASAVRPEDTLARFGGDEFALLCTSVTDEQIAVGIARRLVEACSLPLTVDGASLTVTASAGITMTTGTTVPGADALLREADTALYRAKDRGGDRVELFRPAAEPRWAPPARP